MSFPLPPSEAGALIPGRLVQQNQRVRRMEGRALPTPRSYRGATMGAIGSFTTGSIVVGTLDIFLQPGDMLGMFLSLGARTTGASAGLFGTVDAVGGLPLRTLIAVPTVAPHASQLTTYDSRPNDGAPNFWWTHAARSAGVLVDIASPQPITLTFRASRNTGTGTVHVGDFQAWAMIL